MIIKLYRVKAYAAIRQLKSTLETQQSLQDRSQHLDAVTKVTIDNLNSLKEKIGQSSLEVEELNSSKKNLQSAVRDLHDQKVLKTREIFSLEERVSETTEKLANAKNELTKAESEANQRRITLLEFERSVTLEETKLGRLTGEIEDKKRLLREIHVTVQGERLEGTQCVKHFHEDVETLRAQIMQIHTLINKYKGVSQQTSVDLTNLKQEEKNLSEQITAKQKTMEELSQTCEKQQRAIDHIMEIQRKEKVHLDEISKEYRDMLSKSGLLRTQLEQLPTEINQLNEIKMTKTSEISKLEAQISCLGENLVKLGEKQHSEDKNLSHLQQEIVNVEKRLQEQKHLATEVESRNQNLHEQIKQKQLTITDLASKEDQLKQALHFLTERKAEEQKHLDETRQQTITAKHEEENLQSRILVSQNRPSTLPNYRSENWKKN
ncbi:hypothetical protein Ciccas_001235 [Cichlidogyrus casuarinus]|uniref:Uncharacterized protein n=1 Tax=Cichlidogyrus casuarinus TaxID=1844966 RepID=A0ABD2QNN0_9PLAT